MHWGYGLGIKASYIRVKDSVSERCLKEMERRKSKMVISSYTNRGNLHNRIVGGTQNL